MMGVVRVVAAAGCLSLVLSLALVGRGQGELPEQRSPGDVAGAPLVNEILAHTDPPDFDAVELFNAGSEPLAIGGWALTDNPNRPQEQWVYLPSPTTLAPGAFFVVADSQSEPWGFGLSEFGDDVYLLRPGAQGAYEVVAHVPFGVSPNGVSFGRLVDSTGRVHYPLQSEGTLGKPNAGPQVGPVVLSEIMYHPPAGQSEYVALTNITDGIVTLYDPDFPENRWQLQGQASDGKPAVMFTFPAQFVLPPGGTVFVAATSPATFRAQHPLPDDMPVLGPWDGKLDNAGERVAILAPQPPETGGATVPPVAYADVDVVVYGSAPPWPALANGQGDALVRFDLHAFGDDPANWQAGLDRWQSDRSLYLPLIQQP